eukprot:1159497-Pelagomonas_calceolata.AAC.10
MFALLITNQATAHPSKYLALLKSIQSYNSYRSFPKASSTTPKVSTLQPRAPQPPSPTPQSTQHHPKGVHTTAQGTSTTTPLPPSKHSAPHPARTCPCTAHLVGALQVVALCGGCPGVWSRLPWGTRCSCGNCFWAERGGEGRGPLHCSEEPPPPVHEKQQKARL